ncbi:transcription factor TFIIIB subunit brf1 [Ciborinia camelliae]|nr:transcription factor TFIIIB subunit brf1 [Ciborinia camelliae]
MPPRPKVPPPRPNNPLRNMKPIKAPTALSRKATIGAARARPRPACPNPQCNKPQIEDGVCHNCGTVVDDSNIVAEIQFGESSSGAAVVQGSHVGADQGGASTLGPAFRRAGGGESNKENTLREGKRVMQALANQLNISENIVGVGHQIFKLASMNNFIQGRRTDLVAAVCLYSACRKEKPCRVMLIDFADKSQVNVFTLGRYFKALHKQISLATDGILPVLPEDLIWKFASKLEFYEQTEKVADDAIRMVRRMSLDWMVMGRRPSGVCGACLILAARMNNFRRTVTEVVYVVKVTTATIQKRLEEFKRTPSSALTVEEFLNNEFLESAHDPPSFYRNSEAYIKEMAEKNKKRKRGKDKANENDADEDNAGEENDGSNKRQKSTNGTPVLTAEVRRDADGFAIPAIPASQDQNIDPQLLDEAIADESGTSFNKLVAEFGDAEPADAEVDAEVTNELEEAAGAPKRGPGRPRNDEPPAEMPAEWLAVEDELEQQITEMVSDPHTQEHAISFAKAQKKAHYHLLLAETLHPQKHVSMDTHIGEDEFADDEEVMNCVLPDAEVAKKEQIWLNANKDWLRKQQQKDFEKRKAAMGPPKATRTRKKKPRIGEGQTSAASTPAEAAVNAMKERSWSKKINYEAIRDIFKTVGTRSGPGSGATSKVTSRAGSTAPPSVAGSVVGDGEEEIVEEEVEDEDMRRPNDDWRGGDGDGYEDDYDEDEGMGMGDIDEDELYG